MVQELGYSAVRMEIGKLIYFHHNQTIELYNLKDDIFENNNLVLKENKKRIELSNMLTNLLNFSRCSNAIQ